MARQRAGGGEGPEGIGSMPDTAFYETWALDNDGNKVKVRVPMLQKPDNAAPQRDSDGKVPEFVNVSGTVYQLCVPDQPNDTIKIAPFGVVRGSQWRDKAQPSKAWGRFPPFIERVPVKRGGRSNPDGWKYDPEYLLTEKQVIEQAELISSPEFGRKRLKMYMMYGKVQTFDKEGYPEKDVKELAEDRPEAFKALSQKLQTLETRWQELWSEMTGIKKRQPVGPGTPTT